MFHTFDNSDFIKMNFTSDEAEAARINKNVLINPKSQVVTTPTAMGGYHFPVLEDLAVGRGHFQILKSPLPGEDISLQLQIKSAIEDRNTVYSYVDAGNITIVQIDGWDNKHDHLSDYGLSLKPGRKTFKRLKTLNRPFRTFCKMDDPIRVHIVGDTDYTDIDTDLLDESTLERLLDGAFIIAPWIAREAINNVQFPVVVNNDNYSVDDFRRKMFIARARHVRAFNSRFLGNFIYTGISHNDPLHDRPGMLKGEAFTHTSDICEIMKVDVIAARSAIKSEVSCTGRTYLLMEAQSPKLEGVVSDLQTKINLPALYQPEQVIAHTKQVITNNFQKLTNNELMEYWYEMTSPLFDRDLGEYDQRDIQSLCRWNARAWVMSGLPITYSPWLFEQLAVGLVSSLKPQDQSKMRFPIICAIRCQVISQSFAAMAGSDIEVQQGTARYVEELESIVVNDLDWLEMYPSHGGCDLDDFFVAYYRMMDGIKSIVLVRSPNDYGEYTIFNYVEGDFAPEYTLSNGLVISFPEVPTDPALWPKRLSVAVADGEITYRGLPSEHEQVPPPTGSEYCNDDVFSAIENNKASQACVGANVNSRSLWSLSVRQHRRDQLTTMESCVDAGAQGGSAADTEAVMAEAREIIKIITKDLDVPIDAYMWTTRFASIYKYPFDMSRIKSDGYISQLADFRGKFVQEFLEMARQWAQIHCVNRLDPVIHQLGILRSKNAYDLLVMSRVSTFNAQQKSTDNLTPNQWDRVHTPMSRMMENQKTDVDRHNLAIALLSICHRVPTSSGRFSDQVAMNPSFFPYVMDAMRFYGLAAHLDINDKGRIERRWTTEWDLRCQSCGEGGTTKNPMQLQKYHTYNGVCKSCREP